MLNDWEPGPRLGGGRRNHLVNSVGLESEWREVFGCFPRVSCLVVVGRDPFGQRECRSGSGSTAGVSEPGPV